MMSKSGRAESYRTIIGAVVLLVLVGCQQSQEPQLDEPAPVPQIETIGEPIEIDEGDLLTYQPQIVNADQFTDSLSFKLARGKLPDGCSFDEATGGLRWTPAETQGPAKYRFQFSCHPANQPSDATGYELEVNVSEKNLPPRLDAPSEATVPAGSTLERPLVVVDEDFPVNRISLELTAGPEGAVIDEIGGLLYWEVPADWQEPRVNFTILARDDGTPPLTATHTLVLTVTDIQEPQPEQAEASESHDRVPEVAVNLPPLPRPGEPVEPVPLGFELDPPIRPDDVRLSLMLPDDLRGLLKMRYLDDDDSRLAILLTDPFEPDDVPGNLRDGIVATCALVDSKYVWTWAMTKDLDARAYQNNIRHGVLAIESKSGGSPRLVGLQEVVEVPAPMLDDMLSDEKLQLRLVRHGRVKKSIALEGFACTANNGNWEVDLESQIDGFSLLLVNPQLIQAVNPRAGSKGVQFTQFGFRVLQGSTQITIGLDAKPSPADAYQHLRAARKSLLGKQADFRRWRVKLARAEAGLRNARRMPEKNRVQLLAKRTAINQATRSGRQAQAKLARLSTEIPADQNLVATMEAKWQKIVTQLQPIRKCVISGELWRRIEDVRVPVLRLMPVELEVDTGIAQ